MQPFGIVGAHQYKRYKTHYLRIIEAFTINGFVHIILLIFVLEDYGDDDGWNKESKAPANTEPPRILQTQEDQLSYKILTKKNTTEGRENGLEQQVVPWKHRVINTGLTVEPVSQTTPYCNYFHNYIVVIIGRTDYSTKVKPVLAAHSENFLSTSDILPYENEALV